MSVITFIVHDNVSDLGIKGDQNSNSDMHHPMASFYVCALLSLLLAKLPLTSATTGDNLIAARVAPPVTAQTALGFSTSDWIWTPTTTANALVSFRKDFTPPAGKALVAAEILINAAQKLGLFVNGEYIGAGTPPSCARFAERYCVDLLPSFNVFAVNASMGTNTDGRMIATILLTYSDGSTDMLVTDSSWCVHSGQPAGFEQLSFDDTTWSVATVAGTYQNFVYGVVSIPSDPPVVNFNNVEWIWTSSLQAVPMSASIIIAADNEYTLYVNGVNIGNGTSFKVAQHYTVNFATAPSEVVLAMLVTNTATSTAGLIFTMEVNMVPSGRANCTAGSFALSDGVTKSTTGAIPVGFEQPGFDDSAWPAAVTEEAYAHGPNWGTITIAPPSAPVTI